MYNQGSLVVRRRILSAGWRFRRTVRHKPNTFAWPIVSLEKSDCRICFPLADRPRIGAVELFEWEQPYLHELIQLVARVHSLCRFLQILVGLLRIGCTKLNLFRQ